MSGRPSPEPADPESVTDPPPPRFFSASSGMPAWIPRLLVQITGIVIMLFAAYHMARALRGFLTLLLIAFFLATALEPGVAFLNRRGWRRGPATALIFVAAVLVVAGLTGLMVPLVVTQTANLIERAPDYIEQFAE